MNRLMTPQLKKVIGHLLVWSVWFSMQVYFLILANQEIHIITLVQLVGHSLELALLIYFNLYVLVPHLLDRRKYVYYALSVIGSLLVISFASIHVDLGVTQSKDFLSHLVGAGFYLLVGTFIGLFMRSVAMNKKLREQQLIAELDLLKAQVNPHFFFNALNSIYSLSLENPEKTSAAILQLSELMHYMFKVAQLHMIPLRQEVEYITHYIHLEKARFGNKCEASVEVTGPIDAVQVPPLLLLPFIENAFKHGTEVATAHSFVRIDIAVQQNEVFFQVSNSIGDQLPMKNSSGTGLKNVKKRLELLFKNKYDLQLISENSVYIATLRLDLN
ncbi:MAG: histidine kinase [Flammeovirgaceae bacterium]|jgi:two-component system LytT family sensor kinase|nr:histidine kinase [Flammeovirgaceae bacterium]